MVLEMAKWKVFFFPHFHYDVVWKFDRKDYSYINLRLLRQVIALCSLFPEFKFGFEDAYQLMEVERENPQLFERLEKAVRAGCIRVVDGQYLMADSYLPGGEVFVREILYGKRYLKERLGLNVLVGWITDSFGLNAQIPQIYRDAGYKWLAFGRGAERKPGRSEFWWRGLDGTTILTHYFSSNHSYHVGLFAEYFKENLEELKHYAATRNILMPCGVGSCPFPEWILKVIDDFNRSNPDYEVEIAPPEEFFKAVEKEGDKLETVEGEMYEGERIFEGVWSTRMWLKLEGFKARNLILNAEKFATIAWLLGKPYPRERLAEAWRKMLFLAFHDVITGTSIDEVYEDFREDLEELKAGLAETLREALTHISSQISLEGEAVIVFNPNAFPVRQYVEEELEFDRAERVRDVAVEDAPCEVVEEERDGEGWLRRVKIGFLAEVPPLGYRVYKLSKSQLSLKTEGRRKISGKNSIGNSLVRVEADPHTGICRILDGEGRELVKSFLLELENEVGSVYTHRDISMQLIGVVGAEGDTSPNKPRFHVEEFTAEEGPISKRLKFKEKVYGCYWPYRLREHYGVEFYRQELMDVEKEITIFEGLPLIDFKIKLKNRFPHVRVRARFDLAFEGKYLSSTAFGVVEREKQAKDFPMEEWIDYEGEGRGLALSTRGIPGHQVLENRVYLTLLRSVDLLSHGDKGPITPVRDALELGREYEFRFALIPHEGGWREAKIWREALSFANPPIPLRWRGGGRGSLPYGRFSFLSLPENVLLSCLKQSEDGEGVVLRCYETAGEPVTFHPSLFRKPRQLLLSNITEEKAEEAGGKPIKLGPFKILTLLLKF
ncbi:MAG: hypothetical protein DRO52_05355 [Candidatus Hecatellales archaeon]|nr:MAG: hypothetical protein DRO52_05355 [Candidatus Hecatellales archaeon]